jgi:hypothetical protein
MSSASVALYIHGDDLNPSEITDRLGVTPDVARRKGDRRQLVSGSIATQKTGVWSRQLDTDAAGISAAALQLVAEFEASEQRLDLLPGVEAVTIDIYCALGVDEINSNNLSFVLPQTVVERISKLGADINVTLSVAS